MQPHPSCSLRSCIIAPLVTLALTLSPLSFGEPASAGEAKALLDEAKKKQFERKHAAIQKELERLEEDMKQGQTELGDLEQHLSIVGNAVNESRANSDLIAGRTKNVTQDLELLALRAEAERLKTEGLNLLSVAHAKAKEAVTKRNEELEIKRSIISAQLAKNQTEDSENEKSGKSEANRSLNEQRRNLAKAASRAELASMRAREAMAAASKKLQQADDATAKVEKKQAEFAAQKPAAR